jgi:predicted phage replisome organizer
VVAVGRYFGLKLQSSFFEQADIKVIMAQPNGAQYVVFWLKLLLLSIQQEEPGALRFKEAIPFSSDILSTVLDTNIDFVRSALKLFQQLGMIQIDEDETILLESINKMIGSESSSADRVRRFRARQKEAKQLEYDEALHVTLQRNVEKRREEKKREEGNAQTPTAVDAASAGLSKEEKKLLLMPGYEIDEKTGTPVFRGR